MDAPMPTIRCRKCGNVFSPEMKTKGTWNCPACHAKNPNLKRHYRSVADLFILGLILQVIIIILCLKAGGMTMRVLLSAADGILLAIAIVLLYKAAKPWADQRVKALIWIVFGIAILCNVALPLLLGGKLSISMLVVYAVVLLYLSWLNTQASKCTA